MALLVKNRWFKVCLGVKPANRIRCVALVLHKSCELRELRVDRNRAGMCCGHKMQMLTASVWCGQVSCSSCPAAPSMVVTALPGSRIIRQSSQPEASAPCCRAACVQHSHSVVSTSLKQLRDHNDGIAGIAADSLRINGAMSNFKQVHYITYYQGYPLRLFVIYNTEHYSLPLILY